MRRILSIATVGLLVLSTAASAQRGRPSPASSGSGLLPIELGADAALSFGFGAPAGTSNATQFQIPFSQVRAGFFVSPALSIEPVFGLTYSSAGGGSDTYYTVGVGALYHFSTIRSENQVYVRPFIDFMGTNASFGTTTRSLTGTVLGAGLGVKIPAADRLVYRLEANLAHNSNSNFDNSPNRIGLLAGLSYYTH